MKQLILANGRRTTIALGLTVVAGGCQHTPASSRSTAAPASSNTVEPSSSSTPSPRQVDRGFSWPHGAKAAVSLTYDDGMESQLRVVAPHLEQTGHKATFFINEVADDAPWRTLRERGHELAGHTQHHPCPRSLGVPTTPSEDLDLDQMARELDGDIEQLRRLGQSPPFSFAYPCGVTWVGAQKSYVELVKRRFGAARLADHTETMPRDLHLVSARFGLTSLKDLNRAVDAIVEAGGWLVLGFHGVGGGWLVTEPDVHLAFLQQLSEREDVWVAPFGSVAEYVHAD